MEKQLARAGCAMVVGALILIWAARLTIPRAAYVSELGADGQATAPWFRMALLLIVVGGSAIAWAGRGIRSSVPLLGRWTPAMSLWVGCGFFLLAAQVPCSAGCPLPVGDTFTWQDFTHTVAAVIAFAAACVAMVQAAFAVGHRGLARMSLTAGIGVAVTAGTGGILSLARVGTDVGSALELVATTLALGWLVTFGLVVVRDHDRGVMTIADLSAASADVSGSTASVRGGVGSRGRRGARERGSRSRPGRSSGTPAPD